MLAAIREPAVMAAVLGAVRVMQVLVLLSLASLERRRILGRALRAGPGALVEYRGADGTTLTVRSGRCVARGRRGGGRDG